MSNQHIPALQDKEDYKRAEIQSNIDENTKLRILSELCGKEVTWYKTTCSGYLVYHNRERYLPIQTFISNNEYNKKRG